MLWHTWKQTNVRQHASISKTCPTFLVFTTLSSAFGRFKLFSPRGLKKERIDLCAILRPYSLSEEKEMQSGM